MADSNYYWPGGIPSHIRCRAGPLDETCRETAKGWQLFLEENAVARDPSNAEEGFEIEQRHAEDSAHNFGTKDQVAVMHPNPAGPALITPENYYMHCFVEPANFEHMTMTRQGAVTFRYFDRASLLADQEVLDTGRLLLCELGNNGQVHASSRMWPLWTYMAYCYVDGLGWYGGRVIDDYILAAEDYNANAPLNMELPILELLKAKQEYFDNDVDIAYWTEAIEDYAPGYSEMEAAGNGMAPDFDHANLMDG